MVDEDVVRRFASVVKVGTVYGPYQYSQRDGHTRQPFYYWYVEGTETCARLAELLWEHLGLRRRAKISEVLPSTPPERDASASHRVDG